MKNQTTLQLVTPLKRSVGRPKKNGQVKNINSRNFETRMIPRYDQIPPLPQGLPQATNFSESSQKVLKERYLLKNDQLEVVESIEERFWRCGYDIASAEFDFGASKKQVLDLAIKFYKLMVLQQFEPNSPTLMNAGKQNGMQYSACFVLPVGDSLEEIFDGMKHTALIHKSGGGTGFSFSRLRPNGAVVRSSYGVASGPVSFLKVYNAATEQIKQGGTRRGANMGILRIDHPDVLEFIRCKAVLDDHHQPIYDAIASFLPSDEVRDYFKTLMLDRQISNFNISCAVTDKFMESYYKGEDYELIDPRTGEVVGKLNAKEVFDEIIQRAWSTGDPGLVFIDRINNSPANPVPELETIEATNPCVTGDTWIQTNNGPRQIWNLLNIPFKARINGQDYFSTEQGFFKTGRKLAYSLKTREGYTLRLTPNHKVQRVNKLIRYLVNSNWVEAQKLKPGDKILLNNHRSQPEWRGRYSFSDGYLMGLLIGDGTLKKDKAILSVWGTRATSGAIMSEVSQMMQTQFPNSRLVSWMDITSRNECRFSNAHIKKLAEELGMSPGKKLITEVMEQSSSDFNRGLVRGLFDADGSVQGSQDKGVSIRLSQSNLELLRAVQRILLRLGIASVVYQNRRLAGFKDLPDGKGGKKSYPVRSQHELVISGDNLLIFQDLVGFKDSTKSLRLKTLLKNYKRTLNRERFIATIDSLIVEEIEEVCDVVVPGINAFDANGIIAHNCGEQPLAPNDACNLGSINLGKFVTDAAGVDWEELGRVTQLAVNFLDNVVQVNPYTLRPIYDEVHHNRRIGLGVMGWADMLFKLGIPYNSDEALNLGEKVMHFINTQGHLASSQLALKRGPFPNWPHSIYKNDKPIRNSTVTTIAPTGTISIIADCSSGIEPVFALAFIHRAKTKGNQMRTLTIANQTFEEIGRREGFYTPQLAEKVLQNGSVAGIDEVPHSWQQVFVTAPQIEPLWHVKMQAAFQKNTDNGVSKTINLPNSATVDDVKGAYLMAWETGCSGITVYRDGSKATQTLNIASSLDKKQSITETGNGEDKNIQTTTLESKDTVGSRPLILRGRTYKVNTPVGEAFVTINRDETNQPFEVFVTIGKAGMHTAADAEAIGRLISLCLRLSRSAAKDPRAVAQKIVSQLQGIGGSSHIGFGKDRIMSLADAIAKILAEDLAQSSETGVEAEAVPLNLTYAKSQDNAQKDVTGDLCPECGNATFVFEEGCKKCHTCGYSLC